LAALFTAQLFAAGLFGCEEKITQGKAVANPKASAAPAARAPEPPKLPEFDIQEVEFAETEKSRDPFRVFLRLFADEERSRLRSQRQVVLDEYSIDELKLIGIVTRIHPAKAMVVDPTGKGHVIQRGQFVGRPEYVQSRTLGSAAMEINWRVDRIREGDVVLVREDPANPDVPTATRVIQLRPEGNELTSAP
jgi:type IV pilus assembly protein PilP